MGKALSKIENISAKKSKNAASKPKKSRSSQLSGNEMATSSQISLQDLGDKSPPRRLSTIQETPFKPQPEVNVYANRDEKPRRLPQCPNLDCGLIHESAQLAQYENKECERCGKLLKLFAEQDSPSREERIMNPVFADPKEGEAPDAYQCPNDECYKVHKVAKKWEIRACRLCRTRLRGKFILYKDFIKTK